MFVVDINEGLKEQSIEHLEVLELLGVKDIILVLSKCDLCENPKEQEQKFTNSLEFIPMKVFHTSIKDQESIERLKNYLLN